MSSPLLDGRPLHLVEAERLAALHEYRLLDTPADDELTAVVRVAATVAEVPTATLNLIDENRQCQLTTVGFTGGDSARSDSMCDVHLLDGRLMHVPDARAHVDYAGNPWVDGRLASIRFYVSVPLITPGGHPLGTLCVFDTEPRTLTGARLERLADLGRILVGLFERRRQARLSAEYAEAAERAVRELERSNTELEGFAAAVSHDLIGPLAGAHGYLGLLTEQYGGRLDEDAVQLVDGATRAVERMQQLVQSLLHYARAGHGPCRSEAVDLNTVLGQVLADLRTVIDDTGARVSVAAELPVVAGDPTLLRQLLQNLVDNAIKYRRPATAPRVAVACASDEKTWRITVTDDGIGVPAEHRDRIFDMFAQVNPSARTGHGIGLSTCMRIATRHGGSISISDATPGPGTAVTFRLPRGIPAGTGDRSPGRTVAAAAAE